MLKQITNMKKLILYTLTFFGLLSNVNAQNYDDGTFDIDRYKTTLVESEFKEQFIKDADKEDFKRLREFLNKKEDLLEALKNAKNNLEYNKKDSAEVRRVIEGINDVIKVETEKGQKSIVVYNWALADKPDESVYKSNDYQEMTMTEARALIAKKQGLLKQISSVIEQGNQLSKNMEKVKQDIYDCRSQIDSALAPEYKEQEFRTNISICFTILIGILLFVFFFIVYKKSDGNLAKELLSGNGLQFITLFVLIISVILFGILSILQSSELAAILSGISGYILGKGVPKKDENNNAPSNNNQAVQ
jgi:hypothetical protein